MKLFFTLFLLTINLRAQAEEYKWVSVLTPENSALYEEISKPWPTNNSVTPKEAFDPIRKLVLQDSEAKKILDEANQILNSHGIKDVSDILAYCENSEGAEGFFNQAALSLTTRVIVPGQALPNYEAKINKEISAAYSSREISLPFLNVLAVATRPEICLRKDVTVRHAFDTFVHEVIHFVRGDIFSNIDRRYQDRNFDTYLEHEVMRAGGEFEAFSAAVPASLRLLKRIGVTNGNIRYPQFSADGILVDEIGFKNSLMETYRPFYLSEENLKSEIKGYYSSQLWLLNIYQQHVKPKITALKNPQHITQLNSEIEKIQNRIKILKEKYPSIL